MIFDILLCIMIKMHLVYTREMLDVIFLDYIYDLFAFAFGLNMLKLNILIKMFFLASHFCCLSLFLINHYVIKKIPPESTQSFCCLSYNLKY